jgi:hypothetical protein
LAHVDRRLAFCEARRDAVFAEQNLLDVRRVGNHRDDEIRRSRDLRRIAARLGAVRKELRGSAAARKDVERMAALEKMARHRTAHRPRGR